MRKPFYDADEERQYEAIGARFEAQYAGHCAIEWEHKIKRGEIVTRVAWADNPLLPLRGVACGNCTKSLRRSQF